MLKLHGHQISLENLTVGDIRISDRILIERKTARDIVDSLIDGRLIHQARKCEFYPYATYQLFSKYRRGFVRFH